jgi:hypothetical protein
VLVSVDKRDKLSISQLFRIVSDGQLVSHFQKGCLRRKLRCTKNSGKWSPGNRSSNLVSIMCQNGSFKSYFEKTGFSKRCTLFFLSFDSEIIQIWTYDCNIFVHVPAVYYQFRTPTHTYRDYHPNWSLFWFMGLNIDVLPSYLFFHTTTWYCTVMYVRTAFLTRNVRPAMHWLIARSYRLIRTGQFGSL